MSVTISGVCAAPHFVEMIGSRIEPRIFMEVSDKRCPWVMAQ
jgi:hypothetical protein